MTSQPGLLDALELLPTYGERIVLRTVRDTHQAFARRSFGAVAHATGGLAKGPHAAHDVVAGAVYASLGAGLAAGALALRTAAARGLGPRLEGRSVHLHSALNGLIGDRFAEEGSVLAIRMGVRAGGAAVALDPDALAAAYPQATGKVVVLLHGLGENETCWSYRRQERGTSYPEQLAAQGWTPVLLRYNTGRRVRENGVDLHALLTDLVEAWPVDVRRLALVGHSMGGLVAHAAGAVQEARAGSGPGWSARLTDVVTLATPYLGADLARGVGLGSRALGLLPETAAFGRILDHRSVGILDLDRGIGFDLEPLPGVRYRVVSAALGASERHLLALALGDLLVRPSSASGRPRRRPALLPDADVLHLPRTGHLAVLNHPDVHTALKEWLP